MVDDEEKVSETGDQQNVMRLARDNIKAIIMDVMFGGTETVAYAIDWVMAELLTSPEEVKKVQEELSDVVGLDRKVEEGDLEKLTFLKLAVKEALRLHPPIPLLHETAENTEAAGYYIPAKLRAMINAWATGRDKKLWEVPEIYKPARFLKDGAGQRSCAGMELGLYELEMDVAQLLHCFSWELTDGMKPSKLDINDKFGRINSWLCRTRELTVKLFELAKNISISSLFMLSICIKQFHPDRFEIYDSVTLRTKK